MPINTFLFIGVILTNAILHPILLKQRIQSSLDLHGQTGMALRQSLSGTKDFMPFTPSVLQAEAGLFPAILALTFIVIS